LTQELPRFIPSKRSNRYILAKLIQQMQSKHNIPTVYIVAAINTLFATAT